MHRILTLGLLMSLAALGAAFALSSCASSDDLPPSTRFEDCTHPGCQLTDAGTGKETTPPDAKPYDGPVGALSGKLWWMLPKKLDPFGTEHNFLGAPATLRIFYPMKEYTAHYDPDGGYAFTNLPYELIVGDIALLAEDIDGGNGLMSTFWPFGVSAANAENADISVVATKDVTDILASVDPPLKIDVTKAQVLFVVVMVGLGGIESVKPSPPKKAEAVLYYVEGKWQRDLATGTGTDGVSLIVNMEANPLPGDLIVFEYSKPSVPVTKTSGKVPVAQGAISIAYEQEVP